MEYYPYGEVWREPRSDSDKGPAARTPYLFTSKEFDSETGLTYFGARYYDSRRARWISSDPEWLEQGAIGLSVYHYAHWNPVAFADPDGRNPLLITGAIGAAIGVGLYAAYAYARDEKITWKGAGIAAGSGFAVGSGLALLAATAPAAASAVLTGVAIEKSVEAGAKTAVLIHEGRAPSHKQLLEIGLDAATAGFAAVGARALGGEGAKAGGRDLHAEAVAARNALAADLAKSRHPPATVVGAYSPSTGQVTAGASRGGGLGCA